jgi:hypothetical protein
VLRKLSAFLALALLSAPLANAAALVSVADSSGPGLRAQTDRSTLVAVRDPAPSIAVAMASRCAARQMARLPERVTIDAAVLRLASRAPAPPRPAFHPKRPVPRALSGDRAAAD